jgi:hypothetical protein
MCYVEEVKDSASDWVKKGFRSPESGRRISDSGRNAAAIAPRTSRLPAEIYSEKNLVFVSLNGVDYIKSCMIR